MTWLENITRNKYSSLILIVTIFILAFSMRAYKIPYFLAYHEDQVRDMLFIKDHFDNKEPILLGPKASVGNFYLPPFWYYLMSSMYVVSHSPVTQALMVAILSSLTAVLIYIFVDSFFDRSSAILSSFLYAFSHASIEHSRFAWNPNPIPLFVILTFIGLYSYLYRNKMWGLIVGTISANLALQLHYQGSIIFLFFFLFLLWKKKITHKNFVIYIILNVLLFLPFIIYEFTNNFKNTTGIINFVLHNKSQKYFGIPFFIKFVLNEFSLFLSYTLLFKERIMGLILLGGYLLSFIFIKFKKDEEHTLQIFLIFSSVILFIYKNSLIPFYLLFMIPPLIMYTTLAFKNILGTKMTIYIAIILLSISLIKSPTFAHTDNTYVSLNALVEQVSREENYCVTYDIFPETFIEKKLVYLFAISKRPPQLENCKKQILICELAKCKVALTNYKTSKVMISSSEDTGVLVYTVID